MKAKTQNRANEKIKKELPLDDQNYILFEYPDYFTNGSPKKIKVKDLGKKFAYMNSFFMDYLKQYHIPTAFIKTQDENSLKFIKYDRFDFQVKIFNQVDKRTAKIFSKKEGETLHLPVFEFHYGNRKDSLISESHIITFELCTYDDLKIITRICSKVNAVLKSFFERRGEMLAEVSCSFGKNDDKIYIVDDFTPKSLKVLPLSQDSKSVSPYKIDTAATIRKYTDHLYNLMSS
ncbi:MAG TPA: phosphoribosylaminoimidazolesuccinocarboxamide synthase [Ignavibacteriaceae bacterium]|nr:phosphoribosylaminoimidazolesuccinocarboxamide synthase [Ignavibacteriaceae bacterium]